VGSSDGGSSTETVTGTNLPGGTYKMLSCGFVNAVRSRTRQARDHHDGSVPPIRRCLRLPHRGLAFSAAVASDNQRDQAEPLLQIDKAGNVYDCGPTGFSQARTTLRCRPITATSSTCSARRPAGSKGQVEAATAASPSARRRTAEAITSTRIRASDRSPIRHLDLAEQRPPSLTTGGPFGNGNTDEGGGADRQWMTFVDDQHGAAELQPAGSRATWSSSDRKTEV